MPKPSPEPAPSNPGLSGLLLLLLFIGSGCAALIYEIVWLQLLELYLGSSALSMGVLLGTFMGGMGLGSLLLPRAISSRHHPLRVYACLEAFIGVMGLLLLVVLPLVGRVYTSWGGAGVSGLFLRAAAAAICLLPPTMAMGATLPAAARWVERTPAGIAWLGFFYAGNIAGAVAGSLVAGFYLLRVYDMATATVVAAGLNGLVSIVAWLLAVVKPAPEESTAAFSEEPPDRKKGRAPLRVDVPAAEPMAPAAMVYLAIAASGFCALAAQVIWTRMLGLLFGATVYTFSIVLAVFLTGLGIGSGAGALLAKQISRPHVALGWLQILLVGAIAWTAYMLSSALPYWPIIMAASPRLLYSFQLDVACALWAILPGPLCWGASFPLALASITSRERDAARLVGRVYAANTAGAILGALGTSLLLVASIGSQRTQQLMMVLSGAAGLLLLMWPVTGITKNPRKRFSLIAARGAGVVAALCVIGWLVTTVSPIPAILVAYGRYSVSFVGQTGDIFYVGEGLNASVAVSRRPDGAVSYHNTGKIQASSHPQDMKLQRMLGHASTLIATNPHTVLVIGCGAGVTAGAVSIDPRVARETIVEIEALVPQVVSAHFAPYNFDVVRNPKVRVQIDDARHYLLTTADTFDVITADPFDPWVRGAAALYTKEFFEAVKAHLNPGGVATLWVPLYTTTPEAVKSQIATFIDVFPDAFLLGNTHDGEGYDTVLVGRRDGGPINLDEIEQRLRQPDYARVVQSLDEIGIRPAVNLFATYLGRASDLKPWLSDAPINRDGNLRLQYLAGLGLESYAPDAIYQTMLQYRRDPDGVFKGSEQSMARLRAAMNTSPKPTP